MSIRDEIVRQFGLPQDEIDSETRLFSSGLLDSFSMVELVALIEEKLGQRLRVADINLDNLDSIQSIEALISRVQA